MGWTEPAYVADLDCAENGTLRAVRFGDHRSVGA
jgi:hypothetical protein